MMIMSWNNETFLIGERVKVANEKDYGVITRVDFDRGLIYVLFKKNREETYAYPEDIDNNVLVPLVNKKTQQ